MIKLTYGAVFWREVSAVETLPQMGGLTWKERHAADQLQGWDHVFAIIPRAPRGKPSIVAS